MPDTEAMQHADERGNISFSTPAQWRAEQARRLVDHVRWCREQSGLYRDVPAVTAAGEDPMATLQHLPLTTKDQLAAAGRAAFGISLEEAREWVCTSGTAGRPLDVPLAAADLERLAENEAAALAIAGVGRGDVLVLAVGMDRLFVAGLAYWLGGQKLGATCVRVGPQVGMLEDVCRRVGAGRRIFVVAVPSFLLSVTVAEGAAASANVAGIIAIGEAVRGADLAPNLLGASLAAKFGCPVMSTYASTESCTTFAEGPGCLGGHLNPALGILEVLDDAGAAAGDGEIGEVVITPLGVRGLPLLRFRTGDMAASFSATCACGRTTPRLGPIAGRRQQLLKIRGASIYPGAILEVLRTTAGVSDGVVVAEHDAYGGDRAVVLVQGTCAAEAVGDKMQAALRVRLEVRMVSAAELGALQRGGGRKAQRFLDRRSGGG